jgi:SAM-dependent methyltransferase
MSDTPNTPSTTGPAPSSKATERFSQRVKDYRRYRPRYPLHWARNILALLGWPAATWPLRRMVDAGCGTGFTAAPFLALGLHVHGIEPNSAMRKAASEDLEGFQRMGRFQLSDGSAESTGLPTGHAHAVVAGQAFHWFQRPDFAAECRRLLQEPGPVLLSWNDRDTTGDAFHREYEALILEHATDYQRINHQQLDAPVFDAFFGKGRWQLHEQDNLQVLDREALWGRLVSSSYVPAEGSAEAEPMRQGLDALFDRHAVQGCIRLRYRLRTYYGNLHP